MAHMHSVSTCMMYPPQPTGDCKPLQEVVDGLWTRRLQGAPLLEARDTAFALPKVGRDG